MNHFHDRLIAQLDTLVPFLALDHEEIYTVLRNNYSYWYTDENQDSLPNTYQQYKTQVAHAGFLLGFSYFEAFLADVAKEAFRRRPVSLPKNKELKFSEILDCGKYEAIIEKMIEKEIVNLFYSGFDNIGNYFQKKLSLPWPNNKNIIQAPLIRNCIIHNNSIADLRLSSVSAYSVGDKIALNVSEVHGFGIAMRDLAYRIGEKFDIHYPAL